MRTGNVNTAGTAGRDMRVAVGSGVLLGAIALACFAAGTVASMVIVCVVVLLATAEAYAAFRRAQYHPATLLGLVAVLSLLLETYNKGVAALPLVLVLLVAGSFVWYLARVEPAAEPVSGISSTVFVFVWVGAFGSFAALLLNPNLFPDRHGIAFVLAAVIVTVADDVGSLLVGAAMGRHQLSPSISPNKSWEGLIGGAVAAIIVSVVVVHFIHPWTMGKAAPLRRGGGDRGPAGRPEPVHDQAASRAQGHGAPAARPRRDPRPGRRTALRHARHVLRGQGDPPRVS